MNFTFWKKRTIIELLNQHLVLLSHNEKVECLKAIVKEVCPGAHVSYNPPRGGKRKPKLNTEAKASDTSGK